MTEILADLRAALVRELPQLLDQALQDYAAFAAQAPPAPDPEADAADVKAFAARQTACKAALGRLELLIRLARLADAPASAEPAGPTSAPPQQTAAGLIAEARAALSATDPPPLDPASDPFDPDAPPTAEDGADTAPEEEIP